MSYVAQTYVLQILAEPPAEEGSAFALEQQEQRMHSWLPSLLEAFEEDLTDLLPEGWSAQIRSGEETT